MNTILFEAQDMFCPVESFQVKVNNNFSVSAKLVKLSRQKSKEFKKHRYSQRFKELKKQSNQEIRAIK